MAIQEILRLDHPTQNLHLPPPGGQTQAKK